MTTYKQLSAAMNAFNPIKGIWQGPEAATHSKTVATYFKTYYPSLSKAKPEHDPEHNDWRVALDHRNYWWPSPSMIQSTLEIAQRRLPAE